MAKIKLEIELQQGPLDGLRVPPALTDYMEFDEKQFQAPTEIFTGVGGLNYLRPVITRHIYKRSDSFSSVEYYYVETEIL